MSQDTTPRVSFVFLYSCEQSIEPFSLGSCFCNKPRIMVSLAVRVHPDCCTLKRREAKNLLGTPRGTICLAVHFDSSSIKWPLVIEAFYLEVVLPGLLTILDYLRPAWGLQVTVLYLQGLCYLASPPTGTSLGQIPRAGGALGQIPQLAFLQTHNHIPF